MKDDSFLFWLAALCCISLCGCSLSQPSPEVHHYVLTLNLPAAASGTTHATLVVRPLSAYDPYNQERLVYRHSLYQMDFYNYHRWAASPSEQITDWTRKYLRSAALFSDVYPTGQGNADFMLDGRIRQLDEVDHDDGWEAVLNIDFWLTRPDRSTPLWFRSYTVTQPTAKRNPAAVAEAMSHGLETILNQLVSDLAPVVAARSTP